MTSIKLVCWCGGKCHTAPFFFFFFINFPLLSLSPAFFLILHFTYVLHFLLFSYMQNNNKKSHHHDLTYVKCIGSSIRYDSYQLIHMSNNFKKQERFTILVNFLKNLHSCIFPYEISGFSRKMNREMHLPLQGGYWQQERTLLNVELVDWDFR